MQNCKPSKPKMWWVRFSLLERVGGGFRALLAAPSSLKTQRGPLACPGPGPFPNHPPTPSKSWPPFSWFRADSAENLFTNYLNIIRTEPRVCWAEKEWRHFSAVKTQAQCASKSGLRILLELLNLYVTRQLRMYINPTNFQLHGPSILYNSLVLRIWAFLSDKDPTFQNLCTHILLYTGFPNLCWTICVLDWRIHKKMNIFYFKYVLLSYFFFYLFFDSMTCKYCTGLDLEPTKNVRIRISNTGIDRIICFCATKSGLRNWL